MDINFPTELCYPLLGSLAFPLTLFCAGGFPNLRAHNAMRFFICTLVHTALLIALNLALPYHIRLHSYEEWLMAVLLWSTALLLYLEIWALLSRGYTLAMLLVLLASPVPLSPADIAARYRGGDGLQWIMLHRSGGMQATGLIKIDRQYVALTWLGAMVARAYGIMRSVFRLRVTG
jgi:hypothetical protein